VFPELFLSGYDIGYDQLRKLAQTQDSPVLKEISQVAQSLSIAVAIPYVELDHVKYYNSVALFDKKGNLALNYRKIHLWSDYEKRIFTPGGLEDLKVVTLDSNYKVGILVCFDIEFPEPARVLTLMGAELLIVPTALGTGPVDHLTPRCFIPTRCLLFSINLLLF
jgi:predicted amidohydrolase